MKSFTTFTFQEYDLEYGDEGKGVKEVRSSLSLEIYGLQREQHIYFSNQEYYKRLEELKIAHLRNMAELERMYISQERNREENDGRGEDRETRLSVRLDIPFISKHWKWWIFSYFSVVYVSEHCFFGKKTSNNVNETQYSTYKA